MNISHNVPGFRPFTFVALLLATVVLGACTAPKDTPVEEVFLPPGATFKQVVDSLNAHGLIAHPRWFRLVARVGGYHRRLKAGLYEIHHRAPAVVVLRQLAAGSEKTIRFTVPEGFTLLDIAAAAQSRLGLPADSILAAAADSALLSRFGTEGPTLEGFLLPETYFVSRLITARSLVEQMATLFQQAWRPEWDGRAAQQGLSRRDLVTLASIVEGEAQVDSDRALVAAVYLNRLRLRMPLQADPTVQYALQASTGSRKTRLFERDYQFPSRFNTYLIPGLPPGPIGAPSVKSIEAVLDPAPVPYLYFVAGLDGKHIFTTSYPEHLRAIARIRAADQQPRRATPPTP